MGIKKISSCSRALIIGSAGFLGRSLSQDLESNGWEVVGIDALNNSVAASNNAKIQYSIHLPNSAFDKILVENNPCIIFNCAGNSSVPDSLINPASDYLSQVVLTQYLLEKIRKISPTSKFIFFSSAAVYGQPLYLPVSESDEINPQSPYGYHKRIAETLCIEAVKTYGMNISIVRIFSAYGVGLSRQVVWEACNQAIHHNKIKLFGTGKESRDFMDASDIAKAIRLIVENTEFHGEIYNVGSGVETSIEELTKIIARIQKVDTINFLGNTRAGDPLNWHANISKLKSFGFEPLISIDEGVKRVLDSLRDVS